MSSFQCIKLKVSLIISLYLYSFIVYFSLCYFLLLTKKTLHKDFDIGLIFFIHCL